jgi:hypothetical protein
MMWATAGLVLLGGSGVVVMLHEPGGRAQAQTTYCGLVTCAVLRSTAATSSIPAGSAHPAARGRDRVHPGNLALAEADARAGLWVCAFALAVAGMVAAIRPVGSRPRSGSRLPGPPLLRFRPVAG